MSGSSIELALRAFESRPSRSEALADLSRWAREKGWNETAAMISKRGIAISPSDDLLFVETWRHRDLLEDLSIAGFYSVDPETKSAAAEAAERLSLDRDAPSDQRNLARNTLFWHAPRLETLAPSWSARQIEFDAPRGWRAMNPSVVRHQGKTRAIIRCVNYWIKPDGGYTFPDSEPAISTRNFLVELTSTFEVAPGTVEVAPDLGPVLYGGVLGLEDLRLFTWHDELRFIACARQMNEYGRVEQVTGRLGLDGTVEEMEVIRRPWVGPAEKNWMPVLQAEDRFSEPHFVYRCDPTTLVSASLVDTPTSHSAPIAADNFSGSSQLIPCEDGWLCMTHEPLASPINGRRLNQQRFVKFDSDLRMVSVSRRFHFQLNEEIEYVVGLCWKDYVQDKLVISFGSHDRQAWVGTVDAKEVAAMLRSPPLMSRAASQAKPDHMPPFHTETDDFISESHGNVKVSDHDRWDRLALDRRATPEERERARRALHAHIKPIGEVFPSWFAQRLRFSPPDGFAALAPHLINHGGKLLASVRVINYAPNDDSGYRRISDGAPMGVGVIPVSRTFLIEFDPETFIDSVLGELILPGNVGSAGGFEDLRLFEWKGTLWGIFVLVVDGLPEQWVARLGAGRYLCEARHVIPRGLPRRAEKNWLPVGDGSEPRFIYLSDPSTIVDIMGNVLSTHESTLAAEHFRGGSSAVPFDGGWLALVHWQTVFDESDRWREFEYRNRFAWFDGDLVLRRVSPPFEFPIDPAIPAFPRRFQLAHGLAWHVDGERLVVGYVLYEREPWVGTVEAADVRDALKDGGSKRMGRFDDERWVLEQTNRALQDTTAVDRASQALAVAGLPPHGGGSRAKDWDTYLAVRHCLNKCAPEEEVLDVGGDRYSSFLRAMATLGYSNLTNVNIDEPHPGHENGIEYRFGDATALDLDPHSIRFALCQSVIEHGVDWRAFYREMARILLPGGHLFVSTDFWEVPVGHEVFTPAEIQEMVAYAGKLGLGLVGSLDDRCRDACVEWAGRRYTFINLLFRAL